MIKGESERTRRRENCEQEIPSSEESMLPTKSSGHFLEFGCSDSAQPSGPMSSSERSPPADSLSTCSSSSPPNVRRSQSHDEIGDNQNGGRHLQGALHKEPRQGALPQQQQDRQGAQQQQLHRQREQHRQQEQHKQLPCTCSVCGDSASEHLHYGSICCFSCRAFFRRYAGRDKCVCVRGDAKCVIDVARRNDCMFCRLKKCVDIGMKKYFVRGPNQTLRKKRLEEGFKGRKVVYKDEPGNRKRSTSANSSKPSSCVGAARHRVVGDDDSGGDDSPGLKKQRHLAESDQKVHPHHAEAGWSGRRSDPFPPAPPEVGRSKESSPYSSPPDTPHPEQMVTAVYGESAQASPQSGPSPPPPPPLRPSNPSYSDNDDTMEGQLSQRRAQLAMRQYKLAYQQHGGRPEYQLQYQREQSQSWNRQESMPGPSLMALNKASSLLQRPSSPEQHISGFSAINGLLPSETEEIFHHLAQEASASMPMTYGSQEVSERTPLPFPSPPHSQPSSHAGHHLIKSEIPTDPTTAHSRHIIFHDEKSSYGCPPSSHTNLPLNGEHHKDSLFPTSLSHHQQHQHQHPQLGISHSKHLGLGNTSHGQQQYSKVSQSHQRETDYYSSHPQRHEQFPHSQHVQVKSTSYQPQESTGFPHSQSVKMESTSYQQQENPRVLHSQPARTKCISYHPQEVSHSQSVRTEKTCRIQEMGNTFHQQQNDDDDDKRASLYLEMAGTFKLQEKHSGGSHSHQLVAKYSSQHPHQPRQLLELAQPKDQHRPVANPEELPLVLLQGPRSSSSTASSSRGSKRIYSFPKAFLEYFTNPSLSSPSPTQSPQPQHFRWSSEVIESGDDEEAGHSTALVPFSSSTHNALDPGQPTICFTYEEFRFIDFIRSSRSTIIGRITNTFYNEAYRDELTSILMSRGKIKPSFRFMERMNNSVMETSLQLMDEILTMLDIPEQAKKFLMAENVPYACLVGSAIYTHGNKAKTFVEQAKLSGMVTHYTRYLEDNGLADVVPRLEPHYLNPSPWAERETYEIEFNDIMKEIGRHVGTDQFLSCLLVMANLFSLDEASPSSSSPPSPPNSMLPGTLSRSEARSVSLSRRRVSVLLNRYLRVKYGPKKASSKTHHHFYLMHMLKRVAKIYMEKRLNLTEADQVQDILLGEEEEQENGE